MVLNTACEKQGCTNIKADNYDEDAEEDDESCTYTGYIVVASDSARTRQLVDENVNSILTVFVNDEEVGKMNYYNYPKSEPNCTDDFSGSTYEEVVNHTHTIASETEMAAVRVEDSSGETVSNRTVTVNVGECSLSKI